MNLESKLEFTRVRYLAEMKLKMKLNKWKTEMEAKGPKSQHGENQDHG